MYRLDPKPHKKPTRQMVDLVTPSTLFVKNGTTSSFAVPCWYLEVHPPIPAHYHCRPWHDHVGWPSPRHPDHCCQSWDFAHSCCSHDHNKHTCDHCEKFINLDSVIPIHLIEEGYETISIAFSDPIEGLSAAGYIDDKEDWVVRIIFNSMVPEAIKERVRVDYSIFANGTLSGRKTRDIVASGKLVILPGPYEGDEDA